MSVVQMKALAREKLRGEKNTLHRESRTRGRFVFAIVM